MNEIACRLLVIGAGPGGYVCAIRAGQLGVDTVIVEAAKPGGTCLNIGCIPSKALIHAADEFYRMTSPGHAALGISAGAPSIDFGRTVAWKDGIVSRLTNGVSGLLKRARVKMVKGQARFLDGKTVEVDTDLGPQRIRAENVVIATGSMPVEIPSLPFGGIAISSTEALSLPDIPRQLLVVGGGYIGLEIGTAYAKLGSKVTVVEAADRILPQYDAELTRPILKRLSQLRVEVHTGARAKGLGAKGKTLQVETSAGETQDLAADRILVAVGRRPATAGWGLEELSLRMRGPFVEIDETCHTSMRGVYAIGDVTGEPMLAHRAMAQGEMVAEIVSGTRRAWDKVAIPEVCFTDPEIVSVGLSPEAAVRSGIEVKSASFPFQASGRAMATQDEEGFIRVVARADNHLLLGVQAVGAGISELSAGFSLALEMGARIEDIAGTIHAHPTRSESFQEACLRVLGHALHI